MSSQPPFRIGVVGYIKNIDDTVVEELLRNAFGIIETSIPGRKIEIVAGLTDLGTNKVAYRVAENLGYGTGGVACELAHEHPLYPCDWREFVPGQWGDESKTFVSMIHSLVRVGGGKQARTEARMAEAMKLPMIEYDFPWIRRS